MAELKHCNGVSVDSPSRISSVNGDLCWTSGAFVTIIDGTKENGWTQPDHNKTEVGHEILKIIFNKYQFSEILAAWHCPLKVIELRLEKPVKILVSEYGAVIPKSIQPS